MSFGYKIEKLRPRAEEKNRREQMLYEHRCEICGRWWLSEEKEGKEKI